MSVDDKHRCTRTTQSNISHLVVFVQHSHGGLALNQQHVVSGRRAHENLRLKRVQEVGRARMHLCRGLTRMTIGGTRTLTQSSGLACVISIGTRLDQADGMPA